jgi:hypothetical protein
VRPASKNGLWVADDPADLAERVARELAQQVAKLPSI